MNTYAMLIDGEWVPARSGKTFEVKNPATDEVLARVPDGAAEDVDRAVKAARRAFDEAWRDVTAQERGRILLRLAEVVRRELKRLAELETLNSGKPIVESEFDLNDAATCFEYYGGLATKLHGEVLTVPDNAVSLALKEPIGVAGQIIPWNYPLLMAAWKLAPALCAGCSMVIKPAEQTPLTLLELARFFGEVGLPKGVVNVELGGKSPNICFADSDCEAAVDGALFGVFINQGEVCSAGSRVLVERPIYKKMLDAMVEKAKRIKLGPGLERETKMGPLVSKEQYDRVSSYLELGKKEAKVAIGGGRPADAALQRGYFVEPTIFYDVDNAAIIAREEVFGPVMAVIPFDDEAEALRIANDSDYGLAAAGWGPGAWRSTCRSSRCTST